MISADGLMEFAIALATPHFSKLGLLGRSREALHKQQDAMEQIAQASVFMAARLVVLANQASNELKSAPAEPAEVKEG